MGVENSLLNSSGHHRATFCPWWLCPSGVGGRAGSIPPAHAGEGPGSLWMAAEGL